MDWQQAVSLGIVAGTAAMLARSRLRQRKSSVTWDTPCACHAANRVPSAGSIVYRARKGERPKVPLKLR